MKKLEKRVVKLERRLRHWAEKLDELVASADGVDADGRVDYLKRIAEFRTKHQDAKLKFLEFKAAGNERWDEFKSGIESAWVELASAFKELKHPAKP